MSEDQEAGRQSNVAQIDYWNGRVGNIWVRNQERLDRAFAALTEIFVAKTAPARGAKIIDVGCGCGDLALALAAYIGRDGRVLGIDISQPMIERARTRALVVGGESAPLAWAEADAATHEFAAEYDLLVSRFGVMFFTDPAAAFGNLRRALKPGGRCAFLCWAKLDLNPWFAVPLAPVRALVGPQPPTDPHAPGPFALSDPTRMEAILRAAGAFNIQATLVEAPVLLGRAENKTAENGAAQAVEDALELTLRTGPVSALLRDADDATKIEARRHVGAVLADFAVDGEVKLGGACWLYTCS